jgi:DNA-binding MarR family transcriptional regulator
MAMEITGRNLDSKVSKQKVGIRPAHHTSHAGLRVLDLENYVPYFINMISNKLSRGSSRLYIRRFKIGVIEWRILGFLRVKDGGSANEICQTLAIDKAAASRAIQELQAKQLIRVSPVDRRQRALALTAKGEALHDKVLPVALERERILLSALTAAERQTLLGLLRKLRTGVSAVNEYEPEDDD